jgi:hypothetical protein
MSLAVKVPEIQNRWSYIRGCKTVSDIKVLKLSCYLWMSYSATEFITLHLSGFLHCFIDVKGKKNRWCDVIYQKPTITFFGYSRFVWRCLWSTIFSRVLLQPENKVTNILVYWHHQFLLPVLNDTRSGIRLISSRDDWKTEFSHILTKPCKIIGSYHLLPSFRWHTMLEGFFSIRLLYQRITPVLIE